MKKITIKSEDHLKECICKLKGLGYTFTFGPSENVTFIVLEDKKMRFEYGDDVYEREEFVFETKHPYHGLYQYFNSEHKLALSKEDVEAIIELVKTAINEAN